MHKTPPLLLIVLMTSLLATQTASAATTGNLNFFLGAKALNQDDWLADEHGEFGMLLDIGADNWPVRLAIDILGSSGEFDGPVYSYQDNAIHYYEERVETSELDLGVRKYWHAGGNMHPYLGGGLALVRLEASGRLDGGSRYRDSGSGTGLWLGGGIQWRLEQFNLGFSIRSSLARVELDSGDYQGGGGHAGLLLGFRW